MFEIPQDAMDRLADEEFIRSEACQLSEETQRNLTQAVEKDDLATVKFFIQEQGIPLDERMNNAGEKLVHIATRHGSLKVIDYILDIDPSMVAETDRHGFDALHIAIEEGLADMVEFLVEECNADIHEANPRDLRCTAIHSAIEFGHLNIVKYLIEKRHVDVNTPTHDTYEEPPLFLAVRYQQGHIIDYLINEREANVTILNGLRENILYIAVKKNDLAFMKYLMDEKKVKFDVNWKNDGSETLAYVAAHLNRFNILKYLVEKKRADINIPDKWTNITCLHLAASQNHFEVCKYLIEHGANTQFKDKDGQLPAEKASDESLIHYLRTHQSTRSRRNVPTIDRQSTVSSMSDSTFRSFRIGSGYLSGPTGQREMETKIDSSGYFQSFLLMLTSMVRITNNFNQRVESLPTFRTSRQEIDPIAIDVVSGTYRIRNLYE